MGFRFNVWREFADGRMSHQEFEITRMDMLVAKGRISRTGTITLTEHHLPLPSRSEVYWGLKEAGARISLPDKGDTPLL